MAWRPKTREPISTPRAGPGHGCGMLFAVVFGIAGLAMAIPLFMLPAWRVVQARTWVETPCVIVASRIDTRRGDDGDVHRLEVRYRYRAPPRVPGTAPGGEREGDRYDFSTGYSSRIDDRARMLAALPPGSPEVCWVDREHPERAVLVRGMTARLWTNALILVFPAFALVLMLSLRSRRRSVQAGVAAGRTASEPLALMPGQARWLRMVFLLLFAGIWNGVVWFGAADLRGNWFTLFLLPFMLVGLVLLILCAWSLLDLLNPRVRLRIEAGDLHPGGGGVLAWELDRLASRLHLHIALELREEATYDRGSSTATDRTVLHRVVLVESDDGPSLLSGRVPFALPAGLPATFAGGRNHLRWVVSVECGIPRWPRVSQAWEMQVQERPRPSIPPPADPVPDAGLVARPLALIATDDERGVVAGTAAWDLEWAPRRIAVRLFWYTSGRGSRDVGVVAERELAPAAIGRVGFAFIRPPGPAPWAGSLVAVRWAVELVAEPGGVERVDLDP